MQEQTREILWNIPLWASAGIYLLLLAVLIIAVRRAFYYYSLWMKGQGNVKIDRIGRRIRDLFIYTIGHKKTISDKYAGFMHLLIFFGFLTLFIGTVIVWIEHRTPLHFFYGNFYLIFSLIMDIAGLLLIAGILMALYRRFVIKPERIKTNREDIIILLTLLIIAITGFFIEGARIAANNFPPFEIWSPVGHMAARLMVAVHSPEQIPSLHRVFWIFHAILAFYFIGLIAYTKLAHIFISSLNIFFRSYEPKGALSPVYDMERLDSLGVAKLEDFTWKQLLDLDACKNVRCGRCQDECPAHLSEKPLSPKCYLRKLDAHMHEKDAPAMYEMITEDEIWSCTTCGACREACPVLVEQVDKIVDMRRHLLFSGKLTGNASRILQNMMNSGNPYGQPRSARADWAEGLGVKMAEEGKDNGLLYWVGCAGAYDARNQKVARAMVNILNRAGIGFSILGAKETCTGDAARRMGEEGLFQMLANQNIETLKKHNIKKILTHCPHCLNTIKNEYPQFGGEFEVIHHSEFISNLIKEGKIRLQKELNSVATYHDSCYLGRYNDIYNPPRSILNAISGIKLKEMDRTMDKSFCCGAGGGHMWMEINIGKKINHMRIEQAAGLNPDIVATACPFCLVMLDDAAKAKGLEEKIRVKDIALLVEEAMR
ncbi:MAG: heterodisulfide reductase-related iron-sulfur binding cluster [Nitrospirota bacterium]